MKRSPTAAWFSTFFAHAEAFAQGCHASRLRFALGSFVLFVAFVPDRDATVVVPAFIAVTSQDHEGGCAAHAKPTKTRGTTKALT